ncbi:MAG: response regulator transcription factor [Bacteroidota bacterium]
MDVTIVEDEDLAAERLISLLNEIDPDIQVKKVLKSVEQSVGWFSENSSDLILLDIDLSDDLSFNIFSQVQIDTPIIFTTAHNEYAIKAFDQNSIAYLLKPIERGELEKALEKYHRLNKPQDSQFEQLFDQLRQVKTSIRSDKGRITVNYGGKMRSIAVKDIAVFYIENKMAFLKTMDGSRYVFEDTLDALSTRLDNDFFRANRQYVVNINAIDQVIPFSARKLKVELTVEVPEYILISSEKITPFKRWFNGNDILNRELD